MPIYKISGKKRDGLQKYRVVYNYTDASGKKRTKERLVYGKAQAEVAEIELRKLADGESAVSEEKAPLTVAQLWELYEKEKRHDIRATTLEKKASIVRNQIAPYLGVVPITELSPETLTAWRTALNETGRKASTKNNAYRDLRAMLNFAVSRKLISESPLKAVPPFRDPYQETDAVKLRYYTKDEFTKFIAAAREEADSRTDLRSRGVYVFFMLAYYTGLRKGEIHALRWTDIDGDYLWVRRSITQKLKGEPWVETPPKNPSSVRRLQIPAPLKAVLDDFKAEQRRGPVWKESFFVVGGPAPIPDTTIEKANERFAAAAGVKKITIHEFRHSHASILCNAGINIKEIARRLGHADPEITLKTYSHLYPAEEERAVAVLNDV